MTPASASDGRLLVTVHEAMQIAGVTRRTVYNWMTAGRVDYCWTAGVGRRIYADSLFRRGNSDSPTFARETPVLSGPEPRKD